MGNTTNGFGKKRDTNQYGEVEKDKKSKISADLPKKPNYGKREEE